MATAALVALVTAGLSGVMALAWAVGRRPGLSGWIDAAWVFATGTAGLVYALAAGGPRGALVAVLVAAWALRLGLHIAARAARGGEDPRYARLKADWGDRADARLFRFLQLQAAAGALLALAVGLAAANPAPFPGPLDLLGAAIVGLALAGEAVADAQLAACRRRGERLCRDGLWAWSRHPNYFFEWLVWVGLALVAVDPGLAWPWGLLALAAPAYVWWLLTRVSGLPPLEAHMARTRGEAWRAYAAVTSSFLPRPPRRRPVPGEPG